MKYVRKLARICPLFDSVLHSFSCTFSITCCFCCWCCCFFCYRCRCGFCRFCSLFIFIHDDFKNSFAIFSLKSVQFTHRNWLHWTEYDIDWRCHSKGGFSFIYFSYQLFQTMYCSQVGKCFEFYMRIYQLRIFWFICHCIAWFQAILI